jgi:hypothetical protein
MAPFWAELFDVATNVVGEDIVNNPPIACDMKHSDTDDGGTATSTLMLFSTLCAGTESTTISCDEHPEYAGHLRDMFPGVCVEKHGHPLVRSRLGSLKHKFDPLCQQRPKEETTCDFKHGTLHGHQGQSVTDLESQQFAPVLQQGFWCKGDKP